MATPSFNIKNRCLAHPNSKIEGTVLEHGGDPNSLAPKTFDVRKSARESGKVPSWPVGPFCFLGNSNSLWIWEIKKIEFPKIRVLREQTHVPTLHAAVWFCYVLLRCSHFCKFRSVLFPTSSHIMIIYSATVTKKKVHAATHSCCTRLGSCQFGTTQMFFIYDRYE